MSDRKHVYSTMSSVHILCGWCVGHVVSGMTVRRECKPGQGPRCFHESIHIPSLHVFLTVVNT